MTIKRKIIYAGNANKYYWHYQNWVPVLKRLSDEFICFDYRVQHLLHGKELMNKNFLKLIKKEKPDFIFFILFRDEFDIETLLKIKEISPKTKIINFFGDDDIQFESFSRYYALVFDYCLIGQKQFAKDYNHEGVSNVLFTTGTDNKKIESSNLAKKYDVTFIGAPKDNRAELIHHLLKNNINISLFGRGWENHQEFKKIYKGAIDNKELLKITNESRINLGFTRNYRGEPHFKGRVFEVAASNSFMVLEYFKTYSEIFKPNKEIVMFKDKDDLLKKVNYYLKNKKQREQIAKSAYKKINEKHNLESELKELFKKIEKINSKNKIPTLNKKIIQLSKKHLNLSKNKLIEKLKNIDYVSFKKGKVKNYKYKSFLQAYSLEKSKKEISCCNCYVSNKSLGKYLFFQTDVAFEKNKKDFINLIDINQLATTKEYFLENLEIFKKLFQNKKVDFLKQEPTFIVLPLLEITSLPKINKIDYNNLKYYFNFKFLYKLYSLKHHKRLFSTGYPYALLFHALKGNHFIYKGILGNLKNKEIQGKIQEISN